jgi:threonine/homoserine/homoserine lactone efflux protein
MVSLSPATTNTALMRASTSRGVGAASPISTGACCLSVARAY